VAFRQRWTNLKPPLRPDGDVVTAFEDAIAAHDDRVILLGVTPELTGIGRTLIAVDWNRDMIDHVWPGDQPDRTALHSDWRELQIDGEACSAAIGDGSFNVTVWPVDYDLILRRLSASLRSGGRIGFRFYVTPDDCESCAALADVVMNGGIGFHAFKWRLAMAMAAASGDPNVALADIHDRFQSLFPDRDALAAGSGWSLTTIGEIDAYARSATRFSFPTRAQILDALPADFIDARFVDAGHYELAEHCPLLVAERA
jgi:hypothetical protein